MSAPAPMPPRVRELYEEHDRLRAIVDDPWATEDAKKSALRESWEVEDALTRLQA